MSTTTKKRTDRIVFKWDEDSTEKERVQDSEGEDELTESRPTRLGLGAKYLAHSDHLRVDAGDTLKKRLKKHQGKKSLPKLIHKDVEG